VLEALFTWLTTAMSERFEVAVVAAMGWGVASIALSPCHLASIPLVIGYLSKQGPVGFRRAFGLSLTFGIGILLTIGAIGAATAAAGRMMGDVGLWGNLLVAGVFFVVGLHLMDVLTLSWGRLLPGASVTRGWRGALLLGLLFGVGLGPCTFAYMAPVLAVVLSIAATSAWKAFGLIAAFGVGHCALIVGAGSAAGTVQKYLRWSEQSRGTTYVRRSAGVLVVLAGAYFLFTAI
jgi:cytochrome c-type biogenesis protein